MANPNPSPKTRFGQKGGNKGNKTKPGSGRPPKSLVIHLGELRRSAKVQKALADAAADPACRGFSTAWKVLADYDIEKPAEKRELSGKVEVSVKFTRETKKRTSG